MTLLPQCVKTVLKPAESPFNQAFRCFDKKSLKHHHCNILSKTNLILFSNMYPDHMQRHSTALNSCLQLRSDLTGRTSQSARHALEYSSS